MQHKAVDINKQIRANEQVHLSPGDEIDGVIDLANVEYSQELELRGVVFQDLFNVSGARFAKPVKLQECVFNHGVNFRRAHIHGELNLTSVTIRRPEPSKDDDTQPDSKGCSARFEHLRIEGDLAADNIHVTSYNVN